MVATDGSPPAERALALAADLAQAFKAHLLIFTASALVGDSDLQKFGAAEHAAIGDILESEARKLLAHAQAFAEARGCGGAKTLFEAGDPARMILEVAAHVGADMIVMGKRGRGPLAGLLLGSVSQKLVSLAPCPVTIVP